MNEPMLLYGLLPLVNPSFETDASGADPTGWDLSQSLNDDQAVDSAQWHSAGPGLDSQKSLRQNVLSGAAGSVAEARQRIPASSAAALLAHHKRWGGEIAVAAMMRASSDVAARNATLEIRQFQGGVDGTPGSGVLLAPAYSLAWDVGQGPWILRIYAAEVHSLAERIDIAMRYAIGTYESLGGVWWDRLLCGGLAILPKAPASIDFEVEEGWGINEGDAGAVEVVRVTGPRTSISLLIRNIREGSPGQAILDRLEAWRTTLPGPLALWLRPDLHTNAGRHFQLVVPDPSLRVSYPPGIARRDYEFEFIAPAEAP